MMRHNPNEPVAINISQQIKCSDLFAMIIDSDNDTPLINVRA